jgi:hypothetical protein
MYGLCFIFTFVLTATCGSEGIAPQTARAVEEGEMSAAHPYLRRPNIAKCDEGALSQEAKDRALRHINEIRSLHGLKSVIYEPADDIFAQRAALIIVANATLNHYPAKNAKCFSAEGAEGSRNSNLFMSGGVPVGNEVGHYIDGWLIDKDVANLGHRRWVIDPFVQSVALGVVDGNPLVPFDIRPVVGATLKIISNKLQDNTDLTSEFVAYPYQNYPTALFDKGWFLSFSVIADRTSRFGGNKSVDFAGATITMSGRIGMKGPDVIVPVNSVAFNTDGFGLANIIQWKAEGLADGTTYTVAIANVQVNGQPRSYIYDFTLK